MLNLEIICILIILYDEVLFNKFYKLDRAKTISTTPFFLKGLNSELKTRTKENAL